MADEQQNKNDPPAESTPPQSVPVPDAPEAPNAPDAANAAIAANTYDLLDRSGPPQPTPAGLNAESLLAGFDEDTDFDKDPALKAAQATSTAPKRKVMPNPLTITGGDSDSIDEEHELLATDPLIKPGMLPLKAVAIAGGVIALVAGGIKWYNATELSSGLPLAILTIYFCLLHAATGILALILMSLLQRRPAGNYGLGAARMLVAVSLFLALANLPLPFGSSFLLAAPAYLLSLMVLFRMRPNFAIQIAGIHGAVALAVQLGFLLQELGMPTKGGK